MKKRNKDKANVFFTWLKKFLIISGAFVAYVLVNFIPSRVDDILVGIFSFATIVVMTIIDIRDSRSDHTYEMVAQVRQVGSYYNSKKIDAAYKEREKNRYERYEDMKKMEANKQQRFEYYKAKEERKRAEQAERDKMSSFDTDEAFQAALKRSEAHIRERARKG